MAIRFNADEVLAVAGKIERNGIAFYAAAADRTADARCRRLLADLADRERTHEKTFASMRVQLSGKGKAITAFDPDNESALYLRALADSTVFRLDEDPALLLGAKPSYKDILTAAIRIEKDSIVFYIGMKDLVPKAIGGSQVDGILREEMSHLTTLNRELGQIKA